MALVFAIVGGLLRYILGKVFLSPKLERLH